MKSMFKFNRAQWDHAEWAIDVFLEFRDKHGMSEKEARINALTEVTDGADCTKCKKGTSNPGSSWCEDCMYENYMRKKDIKQHIEDQKRQAVADCNMVTLVTRNQLGKEYYQGKVTALNELYSWIQKQQIEESEDV
jgi:hypothetical protein